MSKKGSFYKVKIAIAVSFLFLTFQAHAQTVPVDRGFVVDRPGPVDNPKTMAVGTYRLESSIFALDEERTETDTTRNFTYGSLVLVRGMSSRSELQLGIDGYHSIDGSVPHQGGTGASLLRYKYNLLGDDEGSLALAIIPKITNTGDLNGNQFTYGANLPLSWSFLSSWSVSVMFGWDNIKTSSQDNESQYTVPVSLGYSFTDLLAVFGQYTATFNQDWKGTSLEGAGVAYRVLPQLQIDAELDYGQNNSVESTKLILGFVYGF